MDGKGNIRFEGGDAPTSTKVSLDPEEEIHKDGDVCDILLREVLV